MQHTNGYALYAHIFIQIFRRTQDLPFPVEHLPVPSSVPHAVEQLHSRGRHLPFLGLTTCSHHRGSFGGMDNELHGVCDRVELLHYVCDRAGFRN